MPNAILISRAGFGYAPILSNDPVKAGPFNFHGLPENKRNSWKPASVFAGLRVRQVCAVMPSSESKNWA
jgi:hypothetical protein